MLYYPCVGLVRHFPFFFNIIIIYSCYISLPCLFLFCVYVYRYCQQLISNIVPTSINVCVGGGFCFRWFRFISFSFRWFRFVSFRFCWFRFVSFRFVSFSLISFRFVSISFRTLTGTSGVYIRSLYKTWLIVCKDFRNLHWMICRSNLSLMDVIA